MPNERKRPARATSKGRTPSRVPAPAGQDEATPHRAFFEQAEDLLVLLALDGTLLDVNPAWERLLGWSRAELRGQQVRHVTTPALAAFIEEQTRRLVSEAARSALCAGELVCQDGRLLPVEARLSALRDADGKPVGVHGIVREVTARRQPEALRQERDPIAQSLFAASPDLISCTDPAGTLLEANPAFVERLGLSEARLQQQTVYDVFAEEDAAALHHALAQLTAGQPVPPFEVRARDAHGAVSTYEVQAVPYRAGDQVTQIWQVAREITARTAREAVLRERAATYRTIFRASPDLIYVTDTAGRLLDANPAVLERAGLSLEQLQHMHFLDFFAGENREELLHGFEELIRTRRTRMGLEIQAKTLQGDVFDYEINAIPLQEGDQVTRVLSVARDITERKQTERDVQAARHMRERIADTMPDILYLYDLTTQTFPYVNRQLFPALGYPPEELQARSAAQLRALIHPDDLPRLTDRTARLATVADGEVIETEYRFKHATGEWRSLLSRETIFARTPAGTPTQILGVAQDVTEQRRLEDLLTERVINKQDMPARLREFRRTLRVSQAEFGKTFGGYSQSQISAYENGEVDISLGLILAIRAQGYPIEAVLGAGTTSIIDETVTYLPTSYAAKALATDLVAVALQLLEQDRQTVGDILHGLGLPAKHFSAEHQKLLAQLVDRIKGSE